MAQRRSKRPKPSPSRRKPPRAGPISRGQHIKLGEEARNHARSRLVERYRDELTVLVNEERAIRGLPPVVERPATQRRRAKVPTAVAPPLVSVLRPEKTQNDPKTAPTVVQGPKTGTAAPTGPKPAFEPPATKIGPQTTSTGCAHANKRVLGWGTVCNDCGKVIRP